MSDNSRYPQLTAVTEALQQLLSHMAQSSIAGDMMTIKATMYKLHNASVSLDEYIAALQALEAVNQSSQLPAVGTEGDLVIFDVIDSGSSTSHFKVTAVDQALQQFTITLGFSFSFPIQQSPTTFVYRNSDHSSHNGYWTAVTPTSPYAHVAVLLSDRDRKSYWSARREFQTKRGVAF